MNHENDPVYPVDSTFELAEARLSAVALRLVDYIESRKRSDDSSNAAPDELQTLRDEVWKAEAQVQSFLDPTYPWPPKAQ